MTRLKKVGPSVYGWEAGKTKIDCRLFVGISGYSYAEWEISGFTRRGPAIPEMLFLDARQFPIIELNFTW